MGESVLLVDCDLRRGRVAEITQVSNDVGLSRLMMDEAVADQAILHTREDALDVIRTRSHRCRCDRTALARTGSRNSSSSGS